MIERGTRVRYKAAFLRSVGAYTGPLGQAIGTVTALMPLGSRTTLAEIKWDNDHFDEIPRRVNVANLQPKGKPEPA